MAVTFPAGGTIFIGDQVQFQATVTLSDGSTQTATSAVWGSDNTSAATVSQSGLVTAVGPGEVTIFADVNPRGTLLIRVFPEFDGTWSGQELITSCEDSDFYEGACGDADFLDVGDVFSHNSVFTQNDAVVTGVITETSTTSTTHTGSISIGGELQLLPAQGMPPRDEYSTQVLNWRSRAETPSQMTGSYEWMFTRLDEDGEIRVGIQLQNVVKTGASGQLSVGNGRRPDLRRFRRR